MEEKKINESQVVQIFKGKVLTSGLNKEGDFV